MEKWWARPLAHYKHKPTRRWGRSWPGVSALSSLLEMGYRRWLARSPGEGTNRAGFCLRLSFSDHFFHLALQEGRTEVSLRKPA